MTIITDFEKRHQFDIEYPKEFEIWQEYDLIDNKGEFVLKHSIAPSFRRFCYKF